MNKIILSLSTAGAVLALGLTTVPAHTATQTWVSGLGSNSGACTRAAPCRTFAHAITLTAAGGEILVVDSGEYGAVTITKPISIVNDGAGVASIQPGSGIAITINAGAGGIVYLRGLTLEGTGGASAGIVFNSGASLEIENCVVRHFTGTGIAITPTTAASFAVSNTIASDNGGDGIKVDAILISVVGVISKSITNHNTGDGIVSQGTQASSPFVTVRDSVASNNGVGLVTSNGVLTVGHSVVTGNGTGVFRNGIHGILLSYGDNDINGNTNENTGILIPLAMH